MENLKFTPYPHQLECLEYSKSHNKFILGDGMGLGKTAQGIMVAIDKKPEIRHCLIVCGVNGLQLNWKKEIEQFTYEQAKILGSRVGKRNGKLSIKGSKEKLEDLENLGDEYFIITNVESFRNTDIKKKFSDLCRKGQIGMCIVDEPHLCIKSAKSQQGKNIHVINCKYKLLLTGTPLMNSPMDLYNLLKFINVEKHSYYQFENYFARKGGFGGYQIIGYKHLDELQETLDKNMLRRMKDDVLDLPPKIYKYEYVDMYPKQKKLYEAIKKNLLEELDSIIEVDPNPLARLTSLRQVTECPQLVDEETTECGKLDRMEELVEEIVANGEKVLIFSNWAKVITEASKRLRGYDIEIITGETKVEERQRIVDDFQNTDKCKIVLGTIGAMGTGLTLTKARNVIFLSEPWAYANKIQAEDRIYRIGQEYSVNIITLITNNSIDEGIHDTVMLKKGISDALVDKKFEGRDLKRLFRNLLK